MIQAFIPPAKLWKVVKARLLEMAGLDPATAGQAQGSLVLEMAEDRREELSLRLEAVPGGERIVLTRLFD